MRIAVADHLDCVAPEALEEAVARLPLWRREQAMRMGHAGRRMECVFSYLLLCRLLEEEYGIGEQPAFIYGEHGKPSLSFACGSAVLCPVHFNLSHCRKAVACVVADCEVGIDVECLGRYGESLARHVCNEEELALIAACKEGADVEFARLWTQKEAVAKFTGRGIDDGFKDILVKYSDVALSTEIFPDGGYAVSVASECAKTTLADDVRITLLSARQLL